MGMGTRWVGWLAVGAALLGVGTVGCAGSSTAGAPPVDPEARPLEDEANKRCDYEDANRYYVSRDPEQCARIRFVCPNPEDTTPPAKPNYFSDRCGCGCEAAP
ncbi:hypothetical protein [Cystobacter fuscus]|uniref:hypothetical protein n=1 Tax=Cystobacter fuscus TaxID=43 RepID=UPI002B2D2726|nr:hypothetical protein F0U63_18610 [Cystobacter fuscus]